MPLQNLDATPQSKPPISEHLKMDTDMISNPAEKSPKLRRKRKRKARKKLEKNPSDKEYLQSKDDTYNRSNEQHGQGTDNEKNDVKCTSATSHENGFTSEVVECDMPDTQLDVDPTMQLLKCENVQVVNNSVKNSKKKRNRKKPKREKKKANAKDCLPSMNEMDAEYDFPAPPLEVNSTLQLPKCEHLQVVGDSISNSKQKNMKKWKRRRKKADKECLLHINEMDNKLDEQHGHWKCDELDKVKSTVNPLQDLNFLKNGKNIVVANVQPDTLLDVDLAPQLPFSECLEVTADSIVNAVDETSKRKKKKKRRKKIIGKANDEEHLQSMNEIDNKSSDQLGRQKDNGQNGVERAAAREGTKLCHREDNLLKISEPHQEGSPMDCSRRKLLILDINGLLADIIFPRPKFYMADKYIFGRAIFRRPFYYDFLQFCFEKFDVAIWSSRSKIIVDRVVRYLLGDLRHKLRFCWDISQCTKTGYKTLENRQKPLVCKELRKIWEKHDPNLPWEKGDYNQSNTLLLDDSPYKALLNPMHTAVFPYSYHFKKRNDNSLGPGGDLRVYLEDLAAAENIQKYVEHHPYGQNAINETSSFWGFYSKVLPNGVSRLSSNVFDMP